MPQRAKTNDSALETLYAFAKSLPEGETFNFLPKPFSLKQRATAVKEALEE